MSEGEERQEASTGMHSGGDRTHAHRNPVSMAKGLDRQIDRLEVRRAAKAEDRAQGILRGQRMRAGTESYVMNYYRHFDRDRLQVDFLVHGDGKGDYDDEVLGLGGRIFSVPRRGMHPARNARAVEDFLRAHPYKLVHAHMDAGNYVPLKIAKRLGIPVRISHSHNTQYPTTDPLRLAWDKYQRNRIPAQATHLFACSTEAARWLYGEDWLPQTRIVHNAIDPDVFAYNKATRERVRRDLGLAQDDIALGHIGRFVDQKNHGFVLRMFAQLYERDPRYKLVLLGEGEKLSESAFCGVYAARQ